MLPVIPKHMDRRSPFMPMETGCFSTIADCSAIRTRFLPVHFLQRRSNRAVLPVPNSLHHASMADITTRIAISAAISTLFLEVRPHILNTARLSPCIVHWMERIRSRAIPQQLPLRKDRNMAMFSLTAHLPLHSARLTPSILAAPGVTMPRLSC